MMTSLKKKTQGILQFQQEVMVTSLKEITQGILESWQLCSYRSDSRYLKVEHES